MALDNILLILGTVKVLFFTDYNTVVSSLQMYSLVQFSECFFFRCVIKSFWYCFSRITIRQTLLNKNQKTQLLNKL